MKRAPTPTEIEILIMWDRGRTMAEIAHELKMTRNRISSKIWYMRNEVDFAGTGYSAPAPRTTSPNPKRQEVRKDYRPIVKAPVSVAPVRTSSLPPEAPRTPVRPVEAIDIPAAPVPVTETPSSRRPVNLFGLTHDSCRWIVDDTKGVKKTLYCNEVVSKKSYCAHHASIAFNFKRDLNADFPQWRKGKLSLSYVRAKHEVD